MLNLPNTAIAAALLLSATAANAQSTGSEGYFNIYNNTPSNVVVGFYTNDGSGWSNNWLDDALALHVRAHWQHGRHRGAGAGRPRA